MSRPVKTYCPECVAECACKGKALKEESKHNTQWYGRLTYYTCTCCETRFVSQNGGDLEAAVT